jgi:hypothetical protein
MTKNKLPLAVALAAFAMACADPAGPTRALLPTASTLALNPVPGYPFPSSPIDGLVTLCKISNVAGTFDFDVSVNGGTATQVSITVDPGEENTRVCHTDPLFNSDLGSGQVDEVVIVEDDPGAGVTVTVDIDQYFVATLPYHASALLDEFDVSPRTATVFINDDLEKRVTFNNTQAAPPALCDFITFGRLVWEEGGLKVVISGNAGGNQPGGGILGEFHIEVNGVDHHVADIDTYGPITNDPLISTTYANSRVVTGIDKDGHAVELRLWDGGEPGKDTDRFWFSVDGTIVGDGTTGNLIDQGNMQYHPTCRGPDDIN